MKKSSPVRAARNLTLSLLVLIACAVGAKQLLAEKAQDKDTAMKVCKMLSAYHISQRAIDDEISKQIFQKYISDLDSQKIYFYKSDIDGVAAYQTELDDLLKAGDVDFAYSMFDLFLKRLDERIDVINELIDAEHDFTVDETIMFDGEMLEWAKDPAEMRERWRKRVKYDLLVMKLDGVELAEARQRLHKRYRLLRQTMHQTEPFETFEMFMSTLTSSFDPHSSYMSPQTLDEFEIQMKLRLQGIGAQLRSEDGMTVINRVIPKGSADKDGRLKKGDKIIAVAQQGGDWVDVVEMKLSKVVRYIRGPEGSVVRLKIIPEGETKETVYELTRMQVELDDQAVDGKIIDSSEWIPGATGRIGVINIPSFYRDFAGAQDGVDNFRSTSRDVLKALEKFRDAGGVDAVVVDLRWNGGGALTEAIEVSGLFTGPGPIVQIKDMSGRVRSQEFDLFDQPAYTGPLVVVINRLSASASEIFAGAIKDYGRGIVIGDTTTHGKGTVQNVVQVGRSLFGNNNANPMGALKVTINQFYRVNGESTQKEGVKSNVVLPSQLDKMDQGEAFLKNALEFDKIVAVEHTDFGLVSPAIEQALKADSQQRIGSNSEFAKLQSRIDRYVERKNRKEIPLKEDVLREERELSKVEEKELEAEAEALQESKDIFRDNFYNKEILHISLDYVRQLAANKTAGK